jgi:ferritin-like metal-binding protein YciE
MLPPEINVNRDDIEKFFIGHLNKIYAAKTLLRTELPELMDNVHFSDLREAINDTVEDVKKQVSRMDEIYQIMAAEISDAGCNGMKGLVEDSFHDIKIHGENPELRDMSILFYLHNIESIEMASFQILEMAAVKLRNDRIKRLIKKNYEQARADRTLFLLISAKYIASV